MSEIIVIDLTENMSNVGVALPFVGEYSLESKLLTYPNAVLEKVVTRFDATFLDPNVQVEGVITCNLRGYCDRCLIPVSKQIDLHFSQIFYKDSAEYDDGYSYYNSKLDATKAIEDEIILSMPSLLLCNDDCKGLCPKCGSNLNESQCNCDTTRDNPFSALKNLKF